jgi:hypothetical protein
MFRIFFAQIAVEMSVLKPLLYSTHSNEPVQKYHWAVERTGSMAQTDRTQDGRSVSYAGLLVGRMMNPKKLPNEHLGRGSRKCENGSGRG